MENILNVLKKRIRILSFIFIIFLIISINIVRVNADYMDEETVGNRKEQQLLDKIDAIKSAFPNQIDKYALYATLSHRGTFTDYVNDSYEENYDSAAYKDLWSQLSSDISNLVNNVGQSITTLGDALVSAGECVFDNTDENGEQYKNCVLEKTIEKYADKISDTGDSTMEERIKKPQSVDLLVAATIVMLDSSGWNGKYSDDNYQKALAGEGLVGNMFDKNDPIQNFASVTMNGIFCTVGTVADLSLSWFNPGFSISDNGFGIEKNAMAGKLSRYYTLSNICEYGFVGGTYDQVKNPDLSTEEGKEAYQKKKDLVAKQIVDLAKYYRGDEAQNGDICVTGNTQTGDLSDMTAAKCAERFGPMAQADYSRTGVLASITLAQAWLESNCGKYTPPNSNNLFGIKCNGNWEGECSFAGTSEYYGGYVNITAGFRVYPSVEESINDHSKFLMENSRYEENGFFAATDYVGQAQALQRAGYATSPTYASNLISIIRTNGYDKWDVKTNTTSSSDICAPIGNSGWAIRTVAPTKSDSAFVKSTEAANNTGQCVWYARGRAIEITEELRDNGKLSTDEANKIVNLLMQAYGNGGEIYDRAKSVFNSSNDIRQPKAGSYIVWKKAGSWGHVGIVEDVTETTITLTEGWSTGGGSVSCNSDWSCIHFEGPNTYDLDDFYNNYGAHRDGSYSFSGYVYFLEPLS